MQDMNLSKAMPVCPMVQRAGVGDGSALLSALLLGQKEGEPGEKVKAMQTLALFKEELSNNLCFPKMEWADSRHKFVPGEMAPICWGGVAAQHPA